MKNKLRIANEKINEQIKDGIKYYENISLNNIEKIYNNVYHDKKLDKLDDNSMKAKYCSSKSVMFNYNSMLYNEKANIYSASSEKHMIYSSIFLIIFLFFCMIIKSETLSIIFTLPTVIFTLTSVGEKLLEYVYTVLRDYNDDLMDYYLNMSFGYNLEMVKEKLKDKDNNILKENINLSNDMNLVVENNIENNKGISRIRRK